MALFPGGSPRRRVNWWRAHLDINKYQLTHFVAQQLDKRGITTTPAMVEREVDTCLRTYAGTLARTKAGAALEETLDCPLVELDLLRLNAAELLYRVNVDPKVMLSAAVFGFALLHYLARPDMTQRLIDSIIWSRWSI